MAGKNQKYTQEFKQTIVDLYHSGKSVYSLEKTFDTGVIRYVPKKNPYDFTKDFYRNLKTVCVELLDKLNTAYNSMMNVDVILLTGGTGVACEGSGYYRIYCRYAGEQTKRNC